jgi:hypothetical protein
MTGVSDSWVDILKERRLWEMDWFIIGFIYDIWQ